MVNASGDTGQARAAYGRQVSSIASLIWRRVRFRYHGRRLPAGEAMTGSWALPCSVRVKPRLPPRMNWQPQKVCSADETRVPMNARALHPSLPAQLFSPRMANAFVGAIEYTVG